VQIENREVKEAMMSRHFSLCIFHFAFFTLHSSPLRLRRVFTAGVEGVAAADPPEATKCTADGSVFLHSLYEVRAAAGSEATITAQKRTD
jgi:hypothetical protein